EAAAPRGSHHRWTDRRAAGPGAEIRRRGAAAKPHLHSRRGATSPRPLGSNPPRGTTRRRTSNACGGGRMMSFTTLALTHETMVVIWLAVLAGGLLLSALCSGYETGVYALSPVRLRIRSDEPGESSARIVRSLLADRERLLISLLIGSTIANNLMTTAMLLLLLGAGVHAHHAEAYTTLIVTPRAFVFGEMVPKNHFREQADRLVYRWAPVVRSIVILLRSIGLVGLIRAIVAGPARLLRSATTSEALDSRDAVRTMLLETS